jgi:hypothetical protein
MEIEKGVDKWGLVGRKASSPIHGLACPEGDKAVLDETVMRSADGASDGR